MAYIVDRKEDMSPDGWMRLVMEDDGDIIVAVCGHEHISGKVRMADVQFCTKPGGGKSPRTLKALRDLMVAMKLDNEDIHCDGRRCEFSGADFNLA